MGRDKRSETVIVGMCQRARRKQEVKTRYETPSGIGLGNAVRTAR